MAENKDINELVSKIIDALESNASVTIEIKTKANSSMQHRDEQNDGRHHRTQISISVQTVTDGGDQSRGQNVTNVTNVTNDGFSMEPPPCPGRWDPKWDQQTRDSQTPLYVKLFDINGHEAGVTPIMWYGRSKDISHHSSSPYMFIDDPTLPKGFTPVDADKATRDEYKKMMEKEPIARRNFPKPIYGRTHLSTIKGYRGYDSKAVAADPKGPPNGRSPPESTPLGATNGLTREPEPDHQPSSSSSSTGETSGGSIDTSGVQKFIKKGIIYPEDYTGERLSYREYKAREASDATQREACRSSKAGPQQSLAVAVESASDSSSPYMFIDDPTLPKGFTPVDADKATRDEYRKLMEKEPIARRNFPKPIYGRTYLSKVEGGYSEQSTPAVDPWEDSDGSVAAAAEGYRRGVAFS